MSSTEVDDEEQKLITVSRAYLLGLHYIQKAVIENAKDPEKVEKYKEKFFNLCDTAMDDLFIASTKPKFRILNLLSEINKERLSLLRYINDLKNDDPTNLGTIRRLEQYAKFSLQTYGQLIAAYNQHQLPPELRKEKISIPTVSRNADISPDNCNIKVFNFDPPSTKEKNVSYKINIYHVLSSNKTEIYSGKIDKNSEIKATLSGLEKFRQEQSKMPRLTRSKIIFNIIQSSKSVFKKKEESIGEYKFPMHLFESDFNSQKKFKLTDGGGSFEVEASVREPLVHPKEKVDTIFIRVSDSCNVRVHSSTTTTVPQPSVILDQPAPKQQAQPAQPSAARRTTVSVPSPKAPIGNTQTNVPAPAPLSDSEAKKQKAKSILIKSFPLLPKEELLQFIDTTSIELMENVFKENLANMKKMNLEMPDEYVRQNAILVKKKEKIQNDIQSGKLSIDDYKALLQKQIPRNREAMKKTKNPMLAAFLGKSADNMEEELKSFDEADDDE